VSARLAKQHQWKYDSYMSKSYRQKDTCVFLINYHLIFCPKRRRKILIGKLRERLESRIRETAVDVGCEVLAQEIRPDHVHPFVSAEPRWAPNQIVARFKGRSAYLLRSEFPELKRMPSLWTRRSFCSTARNVSFETIARDIAEQATRG
jgi:putative transposase